MPLSAPRCPAGRTSRCPQTLASHIRLAHGFISKALFGQNLRHVSSSSTSAVATLRRIVRSGPNDPRAAAAPRSVAVVAAPHAAAATAAAADAAAGAVAGACVSLSAVQLIAAAAVPVAKVALLCGVGAWAARQGLLPPESRRVLSSLTLHIFTPCLLFSKLGSGVGLRQVAEAWAVSANMVASHLVGLLLGLLVVRLARVPHRLRSQLVISCGVGNVGNLPFVLLAGLAADPGLPFAAALGPSAAADLALRYVALSNLSAALIQFPLTHIFLQKNTTGASPSLTSAPEAAQYQYRPPRPNTSTSSDACSSSSGGGDSESRSISIISSSVPASGSESTDPHLVEKDASGWGEATASEQVWWRRWRWRSVAVDVLSPPTLASLAAVAVASVDWMQAALFSPGGALGLLGEVADALGAVCIPALLLVLGANLSGGPGVAAGRLPGSAAAAAVATRLLVLPAVCGAALLGFWKAGLMPGTDPLAMLVMLVMHATPTAVLVHSMATIFRNAEDEVAALLFWQYAASLVTLPLAIGAMLQLLTPAATAPEAWLGTAGAAMWVPAASSMSGRAVVQ